MVTVDDEGCVLVPVENWEDACVSLEEGFDVGTVRYLDPVSDKVRECWRPVVTAAREWVEQSGVAGTVAESVDNEVECESVDNEVERECSAERLDKLLEALGVGYLWIS